MDWYPFYFIIYKQDTLHLTPYQDGCYRRLIDHYMETRSPIPDNDAALARIIGDSEANWVAMASPIVRPFFKSKNGLLFNKRCDEVLNYQDGLSKKLSESGKNGAKKRWSKFNKIDSPPNGHPIATLKPSDSIGEVQVQDILLSKDNNIGDASPPKTPKQKKGFRLPDDWECSLELGNWAMKEYGMSREEVKTEIYAFIDYWRAKTGQSALKLDWDATFRNWIRNNIKWSKK